MLIAYKHDEDQILQEVVPEAAEKGSWLDVVHPTEEELVRLAKITPIPIEDFRSALDPEERSHVELEDDYIFVVINTPVVRETEDSYDALPLGIFITEKHFITVGLEENNVSNT